MSGILARGVIGLQCLIALTVAHKAIKSDKNHFLFFASVEIFQMLFVSITAIAAMYLMCVDFIQ